MLIPNKAKKADSTNSSTSQDNTESPNKEAQVASCWSKLQAAEPDPVFGLIHFFLSDTNSYKVLLGVGAYRDDAGKPYVLSCVKKAEQRLLDMNLDKEYAFPDGIPSFREKAMALAYGEEHPGIKENRIASMQTVSGTGALH